MRAQRARCAGVGRTGIGYHGTEGATTAHRPLHGDVGSEPQAERGSSGAGLGARGFAQSHTICLFVY
jgi:hypothetical protein